MSPLADKQSRRSFLRMSALLGLGTVTSTVVPAKDAAAFLFGKKEHKISKTRLVMGTYVNITAIHSSVDLAEEAITIAYEEIDRLNGVFSRHQSDTPLAELNRSGKLLHADPELVHVLEQSLFYLLTGNLYYTCLAAGIRLSFLTNHLLSYQCSQLMHQ